MGRFWQSLATLVVVTGCSMTTEPHRLVVTASLSRSAIHSGDTLTVFLTIANPGASAVPYNVPCGAPFQFVTNQDSTIEWGSRDMVCAADEEDIWLAPGDSVRLIVPWDGRVDHGGASPQGTPLAPGTYSVEGIIASEHAAGGVIVSDGGLLSAPVPLQVLP